MKAPSAALVLAGALAGLAPLPASAQSTTWNAYTFGPADTLANVQGLRRVMEAIEKDTNGEVRIRLSLAGALPIKSTDIAQAIGEGTIQFGDDGFFLGAVPIAGVLRLPMLIANRDEFDRAERIMRPYIDRGFDKLGVVVLGRFNFPFQVAFSTKPLVRIEDFNGQKFRVTSPEQAEFVKRVGGVPITMGAPEVPPGLQRGTVDGVFTASAGGGKIWGDLLKSNFRLGVNYFDGVYLVNKAAFGKLSQANQQKVRAAVDRLAPTTTEQLFKEEDEVTAMLKGKGMVITQATADQTADAARKLAPYWDQWARERGPEAIEALQKVRAELRK
jgi:TRAP-type C4-dicarboxylate transport system substrate-binding protein